MLDLNSALRDASHFSAKNISSSCSVQRAFIAAPLASATTMMERLEFEN